MKTDQKTTENEINAPANSNQLSGKPKSAYATPVVEKYVQKRREKAKSKQKMSILYGALLSM